MQRKHPVAGLTLAGLLLAQAAGSVAARGGDAGPGSGVLPRGVVPEIIVDVVDDPAPGTCTPGSCSLREAVTLANQRPGLDRIILPKSMDLVLTRSGANENGNLTGDLDITEQVELVGSGPANTVITQLAADRLFHTQGSDDHLTLRQLSLRNGSGVQNGGAILMLDARLRIEDAMLIGHSATRLGGAIHHTGQAGRGISLLRVGFSNNFATNTDASDAFGGALYGISSGAGADYIVIDDSAFTGNRADNGGGALALDAVPRAPATT